MSVVILKAWKTNEDGITCSPCSIDDENANEFMVQYPGRVYREETINFKDKRLAQYVERALLRTFAAGKRAAKQELQAWMND